MAIQMNETSTTTVKKKFSEQEKRDYYKAWQQSGMDKVQFCKEHDLTVNELYYWHKRFKEELAEPKQFSPVVAKVTPLDHQQNMTQLEIRRMPQ